MLAVKNRQSNNVCNFPDQPPRHSRKFGEFIQSKLLLLLSPPFTLKKKIKPLSHLHYYSSDIQSIMVIIGRNPKTVLSIWVMSALSVDGKTEGRGNGVSKLMMVATG
jgi:hypothetical protein